MIPSVLLMVDDDSTVIDALTSSLNRAGLSVLAASDLAAAMQILRRHAIDLALVEMRLPDAAGLDVLGSILEHDPALPVLMISEFADVRSAVDAIRRGALDVVEKPLDIVDISARIESLVRSGGARRRSSSPVGSDRPRLPPIVESASFREVLAIAKRVAATPMSSALLLGESGVGKEVVATSIHEASERRDGPFVRVNLAAIPATMIEAELFGSVRGAYTDAKRDRAGYFASAEGGTILLDEIGEFKLELQSKCSARSRSEPSTRLGATESDE